MAVVVRPDAIGCKELLGVSSTSTRAVTRSFCLSTSVLATAVAHRTKQMPAVRLHRIRKPPSATAWQNLWIVRYHHGRNGLRWPRLVRASLISRCCPQVHQTAFAICFLLTSCADPFKGENKSGLHPRFPEIDIRYPDTLSPEARVNLRLGLGVPQPSDPELDELFRDERYQQYVLSGFFACAYPLSTLAVGFLTQDDRGSPYFRRSGKESACPQRDRR